MGFITLRITNIEGNTHFIDVGAADVINIGRSSENDAFFSSSARHRTSRRHAKIQVSGEDVTITDLGSKNGTWVNHQRIHEPAKLAVGDRVSVGDFVISIVPSRVSNLEWSALTSLVEECFSETGTVKPFLDVYKLLHEKNLLTTARQKFRGVLGRKINDGFLLVSDKDRLAESFTNCSLCTAAAIAREGDGQPWTARSVFKDLGGSLESYNPGANIAEAFVCYQRDMKPEFKEKTHSWDFSKNSARSDDIEDQILGLQKWCSTKTKFLGRTQDGSMSEILEKMLMYSDHTAFAVFVHETTTAHWIYAYKGRGVLKFVDFQTDRVEWPSFAPTFSDGPIAPDGYEIPVSSYGQWKMTALAFRASRLRTRFRFLDLSQAIKSEDVDNEMFADFDFACTDE